MGRLAPGKRGLDRVPQPLGLLRLALLSALAATARTLLASSGGFFADYLGWGSFFVLATACCLPGLALLLFLMRSADAHQPQAVAVEP